MCLFTFCCEVLLFFSFQKLFFFFLFALVSFFFIFHFFFSQKTHNNKTSQQHPKRKKTTNTTFHTHLFFSTTFLHVNTLFFFLASHARVFVNLFSMAKEIGKRAIPDGYVLLMDEESADGTPQPLYLKWKLPEVRGCQRFLEEELIEWGKWYNGSSRDLDPRIWDEFDVYAPSRQKTVSSTSRAHAPKSTGPRKSSHFENPLVEGMD